MELKEYPDDLRPPPWIDSGGMLCAQRCNHFSSIADHDTKHDFFKQRGSRRGSQSVCVAWKLLSEEAISQLKICSNVSSGRSLVSVCHN